MKEWRQAGGCYSNHGGERVGIKRWAMGSIVDWKRVWEGEGIKDTVANNDAFSFFRNDYSGRK